MDYNDSQVQFLPLTIPLEQQGTLFDPMWTFHVLDLFKGKNRPEAT